MTNESAVFQKQTNEIALFQTLGGAMTWITNQSVMKEF